MATIGWITKIGGWRITDSGLQALETYPDDEELLRAIHRLRGQLRGRAEERRVQAGAAVHSDLVGQVGQQVEGKM